MNTKKNKINNSSTKNKPIVLIKYGGNAMTNKELQRKILENICSLKEKNYDVVIVHGGGPFIQETLDVVKIETKFINGHRETSKEALEYIEMALKGRVNGNLVQILNSIGYPAVGLSGKDGNFVIAKKRTHKVIEENVEREIDLGQVGDVEKVNPELIKLLLANNFIPVITCIASDKNGNDYNINADLFAGSVAGSLKAEKYIVLTDVDGIMLDPQNKATLINMLNLKEIEDMCERNIISGGMLPKIESCEIALKAGADSAQIINGTEPNQILEIFDQGIVGTTLYTNN